MKKLYVFLVVLLFAANHIWACNPPLTFFSSATTGTSTTLNWVAGQGASTSWEVVYGAAGFAPNLATPTTITTSPHVFGGLSGSSTYEFYLREVCGVNNVSTWYGPIQVNTPCSAPIKAPFTENFDGASWEKYVNTQNKGSLGACWIANPAPAASGYQWLVNPNSLNNFNTGPLADHTTGAGKYMGSNSTNSGNLQAILRSPAIDLSTCANPELRFWYHMYGNGISGLEVQVVKTSGGSWTTVATITGEQQNGSAVPWILKYVSLAAFSNDTIFVRFRSTAINLNQGRAKIGIDDFSVAVGSNCPRPSALTATLTTPFAITTTWLTGAGGNSQIKYGAPLFNPETSGTSIITSNSTATISGLTTSTTYDIFVRKICNATDTSSWEGPITVKTACLQFAPITENFDGPLWPTQTNFGDTTIINNCWRRSKADIYYWLTGPRQFPNNQTGPSGDHTTGTGKYLMAISRNYSQSILQTTIETPYISLVPLNIPELKFFYHMYGADIHSLKVEIFSGTTWTLLKTYTGQQQNSGQALWKEEVISLASYADDTVKLRFVASQVSGGINAGVSIDDFWIHESPTCLKPSNLTATNITATSAQLSWTSGGATNWRIKYGAPGFTGPAGTYSSINTNPHTLQNLTPNTDYEVWVKDSCSTTDKSTWFGPIFFRTLCAPILAPFTENFSGSTFTGWSYADQAGKIDHCYQRSDTVLFYWTTFPGQSTFPPLTGPNGDHTTGNGKFMASRRSNSSQNVATTLRTPWIDLNTVTAPELRFWYHMFGSNIDKLEIRVLKFGGPATLVATITGQQQTSGLAPWLQKAVNLAAFEGDTIRISFSAYLVNQQNSNTEIAIDDIEIGIPQVCGSPTALFVMSTTPSTATLQWTSPASSVGTIIEYGPTGFTPGTGTKIHGATSPYVVPNLLSNTAYQFYFTDSCSWGGLAVQAGPISGITQTCPPVTAAFSTAATGLSVNFIATLSTPNISSYTWDFGDGSTGTGATTNHTYTTGGIFNVSLIVANLCGSLDTLIQSVTVCDARAAQFTQVATGLSVAFNASTSTGTNLTYSWSFGDGNNGTGVSPTHVYTTNGAYNVVLTITDACQNTDSIAQSVTICVAASAVINFTQTGLSVAFSGTASPGATTYTWDFGDGNSSTQPSPTNLYAASGTYIVKLTVDNICGGSNTMQTTITLCEVPLAKWGYTVISSGSGGMIVAFDGSASIGAATFLWEFGDGSTNNTSANPQHTYSVPGLFYVVKLTVFNSCGDKNVSQSTLSAKIGIEDFDKLGVKIYPNPASDYLTVFIPDFITVSNLQLVDIMGRTVAESTKRTNGEIILNTLKLPNGNYILKLTTDVGTANWQINVQHR